MSARLDEERAPISDMNRSSFGMAAAIRTGNGELELVLHSVYLWILQNLESKCC